MKAAGIPPPLTSALEGRRDWALDLLRELISVPSITGDEGAAQRVIEGVLSDLGFVTDVWCPTVDDVASHVSYSDDGLPLGERPVVVGRWDAAGRGAPQLVLNGHIDVVPPGDEAAWTRSPWDPAIEGGRVFGRGACDMKGGLVSGLLALAALRDSELDLPVNLAFQSVIGEESCGVGTLAAVVRGHTGDFAVILEPTSLDLCPVGAGAASFRITVPGLAAHGALREEGVSAVEKWFVVAESLRDLEQERRASFRHRAFADGELVAAISVGRVLSGDWPSTVPDQLVAEGRYGVLPGESLDQARETFELQVAAAAAADPWLAEHPPSVEWFEGQFAPAETPLDHPLVSAMATAHAAVFGVAPEVRGVPYGSDLRFFVNDAGTPAVLYGPGDPRLAHSADEFVEFEEVFQAASAVACLAAKGISS